ncbi:Transcription factor SRM1 [Camellia lanceoleosa]|uniref:Transcription factor SRM1 n=2 Tax=Camellia lanceoleosa TaxID=1840588 RepID=A0ACC0HB21_9ERIC|nr:Transcription factor SRM1 [Camellia lanceoleosa]
MKADETGDSSAWSREQDKAFENALATYPEDSADWWEKIAADVPGKSLEEIKHHYELLVDDINNIESGCVPLPCYNSSSDGSTIEESCPLLLHIACLGGILKCGRLCQVI